MATTGSRFVVAAIAALGLGAGLVACGHHKPAPVEPTGDDDSGGVSEAPPADDGMCPPETLDRIREILDSKRLTMSRCLSEAIADGKASKEAKGEVVLDFKISTKGEPHDIKVTRSTIKSKEVDTCVVDHLAQMAFPEVPRDLNWSYTYAFESN
jgi:hypothetical protein